MKPVRGAFWIDNRMTPDFQARQAIVLQTRDWHLENDFEEHLESFRKPLAPME